MDFSTNTTKIWTSNSSEANNGSLFDIFSLIGPDYVKAYNIFLYLMITLGVLGNAIVLIVFCHNRPSNTTDWFILAITVCDFISSFVNVPVFVTFTNGYWQIYGTTFLCRFQMVLSQSIVLSSSFLICGLALDRYLKVCRHSSSFTTARARNACILITVVTTILSTPSFAMYENQAGQCVAVIMGKTMFVYFLFVLLIFLFATAVVVFSYFKVTKAVIESEANVERHTRYYNNGKRNKCFGCHIPFNRRNKVAPSTITMTTLSRTGILREAANRGQSGLRVNVENGNNHLQVTSSTHVHTIGQGHVASVSNQFAESVTENSQTCSGDLENQRRQRKSASLRTTKISFLVCSVFIVTWIPPWLCFVLASIPGMKSNMNVLKFMMFGKMTYLINGFSNPIIYTLLNKKFRTRIFEIFCCHKA